MSIARRFAAVTTATVLVGTLAAASAHAGPNRPRPPRPIPAPTPTTQPANRPCVVPDAVGKIYNSFDFIDANCSVSFQYINGATIANENKVASMNYAPGTLLPGKTAITVTLYVNNACNNCHW
jgi:hypothetical protein